MPLSPVRDHPWALRPAAARALQAELAQGVELTDRFEAIELVAGIDIGFEDQGRVTRAAVAVLLLADLSTTVERVLVRRPTDFPYVPGLLSFREIPAALAALANLRCTPELLICDGQGFAHPRRFGLACHVGWLLDRPTIGIAKSRLTGTFDEPGAARGDWSALIDRSEVVGAAVRSRRAVRPVFVSTGHRVGLASAIRLALAVTGRFRVSEPIRQAHRLASAKSEVDGLTGAPRRRSAPAPSGTGPPDACGS